MGSADLAGAGALHPDIVGGQALRCIDVPDGNDRDISEGDGGLLLCQDLLRAASGLMDRPGARDELR